MSLTGEAWALAFGTLSPEAVIALREGQKARIFHANVADRFRSLVDIADLDAFLATDGATTGHVSMADAGREGSAGVPEEEFAHAGGQIDPVRLFATFDAGATLVVSQFHEVHPPLARFCRGLERVFLHGVQANIYLTPPGAQGFRVHYDTHDVLVLQVRGRKRWRLWQTIAVPHANHATPWENGRPTGDPAEAHEQLLEAGDALFVPRGMLHDATVQEGDEPSLHITVGLLQPTWADMLRSAVDLAEAGDPRLREAFPTWRLGEDGVAAALAETFAGKAQLIGAPAYLEQAGLDGLARLAADRAPMLARGLLVPRIGDDDGIALAESLHHTVVPRVDGADLSWAGGVLALNAEEVGWLAAFAEGTSLARLGGGAPARAFAERLQRLGILTVTENRHATRAPKKQSAPPVKRKPATART